MPAPATVADFLGLVSKSGLLEARTLDEYLSQLRQERTLPELPGALAARLVRDGLLTNFQAEQLLVGRCKGFVLGNYRLLDRLGAGGMGTVYLAEHLRMQRPVALKVLPKERADDPACRGRFLREAQAAAALDHPNIVRAYDIEAEGPICFLVMEYIEGVNLQELVNRRGRLDPARAAHYIRQAALGLQHAHEAGLVHRDIKPANLLLSRAGVVKILDMGLARFFQDESDMLTKEHEGKAILGTADYLAPEQGRDSHDVDIRADIYSLGATFFYLLAGRPPFDGGTLNQKLIWHQMKPPPDLHAVRREVPREMAALVSRLLAKGEEQRPQTPAEVAAALTPWTRTPIAPPSPEELPEPSSALRGPRSGRIVEPSSSLMLQENQELAIGDSSRTTNLDLASSSKRTSEVPTVTPPPAAPETPRAPSQAVPARPRRRIGWWCAAGALLLALTGGGVFLFFLLSANPPAPTVPHAPARLRASHREAGGMELQWEAPAGENLSYRIERAENRAFTQGQSTLATVTDGATRWDDPTAAKGKPYHYRVFAVGAAGESPPSNVAWLPPSYANGFTADGLVLNGGAAIADKVLRLTDGGGNEARSAFYHLPVDVRSFTTRFRFQISAGNTADGFTFCIQGINAKRVGVGAGGLGYQGIPLSVALKFDLFNNESEGPNSTGLFTGGANPGNANSLDLTPSGIDLHSGRPCDVELVYGRGVLKMTIRDAAEPKKTFQRRFNVDIPAEVQETTAYVGFTAGTGGVAAVQDIVNWTWE
ncbi:MAG TPA: protein kinase [Gemmataceae bacterium]|jgi:serine/threonine protein kinase